MEKLKRVRTENKVQGSVLQIREGGYLIPSLPGRHCDLWEIFPSRRILNMSCFSNAKKTKKIKKIDILSITFIATGINEISPSKCWDID